MKLDITKVKNKITGMNSELQTLREKYQAEAKDLLNEAFVQFFEATPDIYSVYWTQYTPYFNDGEECVFSTGSLCYNIREKAADGSYIDDADVEYEYDEDSGQFYDLNVDELMASYDVLNAGIKTFYETGTVDKRLDKAPFSYYCFNYNHNYNRGGERSNHNQFSIDKANQYVITLKKSIDDAISMNALYPNRQQAVANFNDLESLFDNIEEEVKQDLFGDHVRVIISRKGIEVQEYEHD